MSEKNVKMVKLGLPKRKEQEKVQDETKEDNQVDNAQEESKEDSQESEDGDGVTVSEEYQKKAHGLLKGASRHEVRHVEERARDRHRELDDEESDKEVPLTPQAY